MLQRRSFQGRSSRSRRAAGTSAHGSLRVSSDLPNPSIVCQLMLDSAVFESTSALCEGYRRVYCFTVGALVPQPHYGSSRPCAQDPSGAAGMQASGLERLPVGWQCQVVVSRLQSGLSPPEVTYVCPVTGARVDSLDDAILLAEGGASAAAAAAAADALRSEGKLEHTPRTAPPCRRTPANR